MDTPWDDLDRWIEELREFLGEAGDKLSDEDLMFISNVAYQAMRGEMTLSQAMAEIGRWRQGQMGMLGHIDDETFRMELHYNHPEYVDVTAEVKNFLIHEVDEPGIANGIIELWAHPKFVEFEPEHSGVAIKHKAWFAIEHMSPHEHGVLGWAIAMAIASVN